MQCGMSGKESLSEGLTTKKPMPIILAMRGVLAGILISLSLSLANSENIVLTALTYMDRQYEFGANSLYRMDCSAFVQRVFEVNGIRLPRSTIEQSQAGVPVSLDEIEPGDLVFFTTYRKGPSHVGIYIGNGKFVHASESRGISIDHLEDPYWSRRFLFAKRVLSKGEVKTASSKGIRSVHQERQRDEIADLIYILSNR